MFQDGTFTFGTLCFFYVIRRYVYVSPNGWRRVHIAMYNHDKVLTGYTTDKQPSFRLS